MFTDNNIYVRTSTPTVTVKELTEYRVHYKDFAQRVKTLSVLAETLEEAASKARLYLSSRSIVGEVTGVFTHGATVIS